MVSHPFSSLGALNAASELGCSQDELKWKNQTYQPNVHISEKITVVLIRLPWAATNRAHTGLS